MSVSGKEKATSSFLLVLPVVVLFLSCQANGSDGPGRPRLVCYAELGSWTRPPPANFDLSTLPAENCDYLALTYLTLDSDTWSLRLHDGYGDVNPEVLHKASQLRIKNPSLKVLVSVGGWADGVEKYSNMMLEEHRRKDFANSVVEVLEEYGLDGLELHWLYPGVIWRSGKAEDKDNFLQLVRELKDVFKPKNWVLTASVPPDEDNLRRGYNVSMLNSLLHQMHIRTLDMRGDWTGFASGHCPLYSSHWEEPNLEDLNVNGSLSLWVREGASPGKLLPTFPFYGRSFTLTDGNQTEPGSPVAGPGPPTPLLRAPGLMAYFEICDGLQKKELEPGYQSRAESPYAVQGVAWVGYDDGESLKKKVELLTDRRAGGAAVYAVGLDDFAGTCGQPHFLLRRVRALLDGDRQFGPEPRITSGARMLFDGGAWLLLLILLFWYYSCSMHEM